MTARQDEILIVEDQALIGFDLADLLEDAGFKVHGPFASVEEALDVVRQCELALAILDVNLGDGQTSERVAEQLTRDGTPIMFVSGYSADASEVLRNYPHARRISKPWDPQELVGTVREYARGVAGSDLVGAR